MGLKTFHICEFGRILPVSPSGSTGNSLNELHLEKKVFQDFYETILELQGNGKEASKAFSISIKKGQRQISVKNYVGILQTSKGYQLEILPKIHLGQCDDKLVETKSVFINMLRRLKNSPFININEASLRSQKNFPILEVFIAAFIQELKKLIRIGLRSDYIDEEENLNALSGKILIPDNLRNNHSNKSKFYCRYNVHSEDNSANRLLKSCLIKLKQLSRSHRNQDGIQSLLIHFDLITLSSDYDSDFQDVEGKGRLFEKYKTILSWAKVFLKDASFTNFSGQTKNVAMLFPMERVFEDYIGYLFKKYSQGKRIKLQDRSFFLVERHKDYKKFRLKPDIVASSQGVTSMVLDTKWKLINQYAETKNYKISQADMYQLYAYGKKYAGSPLLVLIYPSNANFTKPIESFNYEGDLHLVACPFDLKGSEQNHKLQVEEILSKDPVDFSNNVDFPKNRTGN